MCSCEYKRYSILKGIFDMLLLFCPLRLKESTFQTRILFFIPKKLFSLLRYSNFRIWTFMTSSRKYILLSNLESKYSLIMKFGQFMSHFKRTIFIKVFSKICVLETSSRLFCVYEKVSTISTGKWNFWNKLFVLNIFLSNLSNYIRVNMDTSTDSFLKGIL